jgi:hypothetical protein
VVVKDISQVALRTKLLVLFCISQIILLIILLNIKPAQAQDSLRNLEELFSAVHNRMQDEGLLVTIALKVPIEGTIDNITIGYGYEDTHISIYEIGNDYFCTRTIQGGAEIIRCIPFSNISGITYINN